jgi:glycosyltransferase involved in cell wall biosynthesis
MFSSYVINDKRKGIDRVIDALEKVKNERKINIALIAVGMTDAIDTPTASFPIHYTGLIKNEFESSRVYSVADYFINASYEEAFAQTPLEAMACGTPVITTPCSGASDLIKPFNGIICNGCCADNLVEGIIRALKIEYDVEAIRQHIIDRYDYSKIAKKYIKLYKNI